MFLKNFLFIISILLHSATDLLAADEGIIDISIARPPFKEITYNESFQEYIERTNPRLLNVPKLSASQVYRMLLDNKLPSNTKWKSFYKEWDTLQEFEKDNIITWLTQLELTQVFIMKEDLPSIKSWVETLCNDHYFFTCPDDVLICYNLTNLHKRITETQIIQWVWMD